jgi:murein DD-endopeptidase MepM/ murein hydrolase activator NlpD
MFKKYYSGVLITAILCSFLFAIGVRYLLPVEEPIIIEEFHDQPKIPVTTYEYKFGKSKDSLGTKNEQVKKNQTFLQILDNLNIPHQEALNIIEKSKKIFDFKQIKSGANYTVYHTPDSLATAKCIVFEANPKETIILKLDDSITVVKEEKEMDVKRKAIGGVISSSLYESLIDQNAPTQLAYELSKMFATRIDFFKIQEGDNFKIIYDEIDLEGNPIGIEKIYSASFEHDKQKYYAINFPDNGKDQYYDEKGESMKKGFLKAPLKFFRITSKFTKRRFHPVQKIFKAHLGTDYAAPTGTPILAVGNGTVLEAKYGRFNGNYVKLKHNGTYTTQYLHMSRIAKGMKPGKKVNQGDIIGYVGSTGLASGPHVCFRFWKDGKQIDPNSVKGNFSEPLPKKKLKEFNKVKDEMVTELEKVKY